MSLSSSARLWLILRIEPTSNPIVVGGSERVCDLTCGEGNSPIVHADIYDGLAKLDRTSDE